MLYQKISSTTVYARSRTGQKRINIFIAKYVNLMHRCIFLTHEEYDSYIMELLKSDDDDDVDDEESLQHVSQEWELLLLGNKQQVQQPQLCHKNKSLKIEDVVQKQQNQPFLQKSLA